MCHIQMHKAGKENDDNGSISSRKSYHYCIRLLFVYTYHILGKCCEVKGKGLYKVGDIIEVSRPDDLSCASKTVRCGELWTKEFSFVAWNVLIYQMLPLMTDHRSQQQLIMVNAVCTEENITSWEIKLLYLPNVCG